MQRTDSYIEKIKQNKSMLKRIKSAMPVLSLLVITSVFWTLKLTGITMAGEAFCGIDEHIHDENCGQPPLICTLEETEGHYHTDSCIAQLLVCTETETEGHAHAEECFSKTLVCTTEEAEGHTHSTECVLATVVCTAEEHTHNDECMTSENTCNTEETAGHTHTEECSVTIVTCVIEEHKHTEECVTEETICTLEESEGHQHSDACYTSEIICTTEETEGHTHSAECYISAAGFICQLQENEPHIHTEECYNENAEVICTVTETSEHCHTAECIGEETQLCCNKEITEPHTHIESCYGPAEECQIEEHTHTQDCYSDITADVETPEQWESTLAGIVGNARVQDNLVAVAQSQLGYTESEKNFEVDENGNKNGYTRYGQWYGNPYGQWNTMFASFCMHYSQLQGIPLSAGAETMRVEWESIGIYLNAQDIQPASGDIIFLDKNTNGAADAVAIITAYQDGNITVIEGDLENMVAETTYADVDPAIMGYGVIPNMDMMMTLDEPIEDETEQHGNVIATPVDYKQDLLNNTNEFVLYTQVGNEYYAIDASGKAVKVTIDENGKLCSNVENPETLIWKFTDGANKEGYRIYRIKNASADNIYLHPYRDNDRTYGVIHNTNWQTFVYPVNNGADGFTLKGNNQSQYAYLNGDSFVISETNSSAFKLAQVGEKRTIWLDGTNGGIRAYNGSQNTSYTFRDGSTFTLPTEWKSPTKYGHKLKGWYDVANSKYYKAGAQVTVSSNMVFYAYWEAATYDIGEYNKYTVNTVSSNEFITTRIFDYGYLFNVMSSNPTVTVNENSHSETWNMATGTTSVNHNSATTLDYVFVDRTGGGKLSEPRNLNNYNGNQYDRVQAGLLDNDIGRRRMDALFSTENSFNTETGEGIIGKTYLGEGDYLFQYASDPDHPYYGYYYYDSKLNAASYNQSNQRFYVYNYLSKTSEGNNADFLPLNSPYANTEGANVSTYTYNGVNGEYAGTTHYNYQISYSDNGNAMANMAYGMAMDVKFHLSYKPGQKDETGEYGNMDVYGKQMNFEFMGDDDLWVFIDDKLVLDLGGIHQEEGGSINFSTGVVTVDGKQNDTLTATLKSLEPGEYTMHVYYLERGSSASNCAMYFNISPRYSLNLKKEDVLSQELLNGTEFAVYEDRECTKLVELWTSKEAYMRDEAPAEKFTVQNGSVDIWGLSAGYTYYIKEVTPPPKEGYSTANGVIRFTIGKSGIATYDVEVMEEIDKDGNIIDVSPGFTIHGVRIDEENQKAYMTVTNAAEWVENTTTVQAIKIWADSKDHSKDYITVYLTADDDDPNTPVRRIREVVLSDENNWRYMWTGLPEKDENGNTVTYGVYETYEAGYYYAVDYATGKIEIETTEIAEVESLKAGDTYLIKTPDGYLSTVTESNNSVHFDVVDVKTAMNTTNAQWTVSKTTSNGTDYYKFTNGAGQSIAYSSRSFKPVESSNDNSQQFTVTKQSNGSYKFKNRNNSYWISKTFNQNHASIQRTDSESNAMEIRLYKSMTYNDVIEIENHGFKITNTPLLEETSVTVHKDWVTNGADPSEYLQAQVTIKLLADGVDTGRTVVLNLQNGWTDTFQGLPYRNENNEIISYTVEEVWYKFGWSESYGPIITVTSGKVPVYNTTVTNTHTPSGPLLPSTGSFARLGYIYCGGGIMLASLIAAIRLRRKKERRSK